MALRYGWQGIDIATDKFTLKAYLPEAINQAEHLTIYIEGDGLAWITPTRVSDDPTPMNPLALKLALALQGENAVYLARPCQYLKNENPECTEYFWTKARFSREVIESSSQAIDKLKAMFAADKLTLVGYSGGGAVAALVATSRNDVDRLVTVAGNLDHRAWTYYHNVTPLSDSLNVADRLDRLRHIQQIHFVGSDDEIIPPLLLNGFDGVKVIPGFDHHCCWVENWQMLWSQIREKFEGSPMM
jgi:hypothetical protein